ncbi:MAG TPA: pseudouridine synthase [Pyrinomonadaceae bacterium]|nr:pseudouridine synthase [Pyrinomonadaceae bacterium]
MKVAKAAGDEGRGPGEPLPQVEGVGPSRRRLPAGGWETVLDFLSEQYARVGRDAWRGRCERGLVLDEAGRRIDAETPYRAGACVYYYREPETERAIPFDERVLHADEHILVADKPHFLPVVPAGRYLRETLLVRLRRKTGLESLAPLHRIDRETAGLVVFSVNPSTRGAYASLFRERAVGKVYEALAAATRSPAFPVVRRSRVVAGEPFFRMREAEGEPNSETRVEVLEEGRAASLYRLRPVTGRKHQLRVHMNALGVPIFNDRLYPEVLPEAPEDFDAPLRLLAKSLSFRDPVTGRELHFESARRLYNGLLPDAADAP